MTEIESPKTCWTRTPSRRLRKRPTAPLLEEITAVGDETARQGGLGFNLYVHGFKMSVTGRLGFILTVNGFNLTVHGFSLTVMGLRVSVKKTNHLHKETIDIHTETTHVQTQTKHCHILHMDSRTTRVVMSI